MVKKKKSCKTVKYRVNKARTRIAKAKKKTQLEIAKARKNTELELARAKKKFLATERKVKAYAKTHPEKAAAIAAGLGIVVGAGLTALLRKGKRK